MSETKQFQGSLTKEEVIAGRGDLSPFLVHLTRNGKVKLWADIYTDLKLDDSRTIDAKTCLERIIMSGEIKAVSPFGYFQYKVPWQPIGRPWKNLNSKVQRHWLRSVCFTETPIDHVHFQMREIEGRRLAFQPYGLAFWEKSVRAKGGNPIFYFDSNNTAMRDAFDAMAISDDCEQYKTLLPMYDSFGPRLFGVGEVDFRWEREWRVAGDVSFDTHDIAFGICDQSEIPYFENMVDQKFPFVDPREDMAALKARLRQRISGIKI